MRRLPALFLCLSLLVRPSCQQVNYINEVIADTLRQTIDVYLTDHPLSSSDPREGLIKLACLPCKLVIMLARLATQNIPGFKGIITGLCTFILGDEQTCIDQVGFIILALEFADNTQGCQRFWACAVPLEDREDKLKARRSVVDKNVNVADANSKKGKTKRKSDDTKSDDIRLVVTNRTIANAFNRQHLPTTKRQPSTTATTTTTQRAERQGLMGMATGLFDMPLKIVTSLASGLYSMFGGIFVSSPLLCALFWFDNSTMEVLLRHIYGIFRAFGRAWGAVVQAFSSTEDDETWQKVAQIAFKSYEEDIIVSIANQERNMDIDWEDKEDCHVVGGDRGVNYARYQVALRSLNISTTITFNGVMRIARFSRDYTESQWGGTIPREMLETPSIEITHSEEREKIPREMKF